MNNSSDLDLKGQIRGLYKSGLTRRIVTHYVLALIAFFVCFCLLGFSAAYMASLFIWQPYDPTYQFLHWFKEHIVLVSCIGGITGWAVITYYYMAKPLRYLDEMLAAAEKLASLGTESIALPSEMKNVQDELNHVREQALRNALLAKDAEQRKNDLIVYLAHDLKTPLTSVIGYLTLLRDEPQISPELRAKYTGIALEKAQRLEELINEFFDITRFSLTALTLEPEHISLSRMLEQTVSEFEPILAEKSLNWKTDIMQGVEIYCDSNKLERVFDNLIRNAVNYSYPQSEIALSMQQVGKTVQIRLSNRGRTIPPEKLSHIFEQFYRVDSARSSSTGGAGLGLAIAKEIVELHGGTISAQSEQESILFTLYLPVGLLPSAKP